MKGLNNLPPLSRFWGLVAVAAVFSLLFTISSFGGITGRNDDIRPGAMRVKLSSQLKVSLPEGGAERWGVPHLDNYLNAINALWVERTFPYCLPPTPKGTDLTRTFNVYFPVELDVQTICQDLQKLYGVEYAEPWTIARLFLDHNDPDRNRQYYLDLLQANEAQEYETGNPDVVIGLCDNGTDLDHQDLAGSIWVNPGEDLNGNGVVDENERNNRDDDRNGHNDDFYGWDFARNDNDPNNDVNNPHGTHTAGLIAAMTNNRIGIASVAFDCKIMVVRCGRGDNITNGPESIEYAATNGAKVINCSWGSARADQTLAEAVNYAFEQDALVVCAAGNSNSPARNYPAAYENSLAVAATDRDDRKANFSSYGDWVDVAAPGEGIYSTLLNDTYGNMDGTSMASPLTASVAALIRSAYSDFNNIAARTYLLIGVDELADQRLGAGRVNALRALRASDYPIIEMMDFDIIQDGNRNGELDPDERASLAVTVRNLGQAAEEVLGFLSTDDPTIRIITGEVIIPPLNPGESYTNTVNPFVIQVLPNTVPHTVALNVRVSVQPGDIDIRKRFEFLIGVPAVLVVDDDDGEEFQEVIDDALLGLKLGFLDWDVVERQAPDFEDIQGFALTIWVTGNSFPPLDDMDRWGMEMAIRQGANIFLMGKWIGDMPENQPFLRSNFGIFHERDSVAAEYVKGYGIAAPEDLEVALFDPQGGQDTLLDARISPSTLRTNRGTDTLLVYMNQGRSMGAAGATYLNRETGSHLVYLGFNLEMAADVRSPRCELVAWILEWMTDYQLTPQRPPELPESWTFDPAYPNPFNGTVNLRFITTGFCRQDLTVTDLNGRVITNLFQGMASRGEHRFSWNAENIPAGVYIARLSTTGRAPIEQKLVLLK